jgi:ribosomal protein S18 acetylase RimI-like enzyme
MAPRNNDSGGIIIRQARKADLSVLVDFLVKLAVHVAGGTPQTLKKTERKRLRDLLTSALVDENKLVIVAEVPDNGLVGMGYIYIWRSQGIWEQLGDVEFKSGVIDDIWVEPDYRKLGIFHAMLDELVSFAEDRRVHELILEYSLSNKEAEATWSKLGFKPTGVRAAAFTATVRKVLSDRNES